MTTVSILPERAETNQTTYRAIAGSRQATGKTVGEAIDRLTAQLDPDERVTIYIVQNLSPDRFFTNEQQQRLDELMARWRIARDSGVTLPQEEQTELDALSETELLASARRAETILNQVQ